MAGCDVYLIGAEPDRLIAGRLAEALRSAGVKVFASFDSVQPGDKWDEVLPRAMGEADVTIVIVSSEEGQSYYYLEQVAEAIYASERTMGRRRVMPVLISRSDGSIPEPPFGLRRRNAFVLSHRDSGVQEVARQVAALVNEPEKHMTAVIDVDRYFNDLLECRRSQPRQIPSASPAEEAAFSIELATWAASCSSIIEVLLEYVSEHNPVELEYELFPLAAAAQETMASLEHLPGVSDRVERHSRSTVLSEEASARVAAIVEMLRRFNGDNDGSGHR